jgi:hypothetical protein
MSPLTLSILNALKVLPNGASVLLPNSLVPSRAKNSFVVFLKPELLGYGLPYDSITWAIETVLGALQGSAVSIDLAAIFSGGALARSRQMDAHYRFINQVSRLGLAALASKEAEAVRSIAGSREILGGHQVLERFPHLSASSLKETWLSVPNVKIRSGLYVVPATVGGRELVMLNGFHPAQLEHFTRDSARILVLLCSSDLSWTEIKDGIIGDTFPEKAVPGSLRGLFFRQGASHGLDGVSVSKNCVHGSAGPFEAAWEVENFFLRGHLLQASKCSEALPATRLLKLAGQPGLTQNTLFANPGFVLKGRETDLFSITENKDFPEAATMLADLVKQGLVKAE